MDFLINIFSFIVMNYWNAIKNLSQISSIYSDMTSEGTWVATLVTNLKNLVGLSEKSGFIQAFQGVGIAIALTYFLISIIGLVTEDRFTPEFLVKFFAKLVISVAVILWSDSLLIGFIDFGDALGNVFSKVTEESFILSEDGKTKTINESFEIFITNFVNSVEKETKYTISGPIIWDETDKCYYFSPEIKKNKDSADLIECLGLGVAMCVSGALLCLVATVGVPIIMAAILFIELSRIVELFIRGSLLPIAAGVMADDGWRGAGGRYFKKVLALATQKLVLSLSCVITSAMVTSYLMSALESTKGGNVWEFVGESFITIITACAVAVAGVNFMFKSLQVMNDLWGAS